MQARSGQDILHWVGEFTRCHVFHVFHVLTQKSHEHTVYRVSRTLYSHIEFVYGQKNNLYKYIYLDADSPSVLL